MFGTSCLTQVLEVWTGTHMVNYTIDRTFIRNVSTTTLQTKWNIHHFVYCLHYLRPNCLAAYFQDVPPWEVSTYTITTPYVVDKVFYHFYIYSKFLYTLLWKSFHSFILF